MNVGVNEKRQRFLNPKKVIESLEVSSGNTVIDFGCGSGFWTVLLAEKVLPGGKVYAIDGLDSNLDIVQTRAKAKNLSNIIYKKAPYGAGEIPVSDKADLIIISNILSLIKNDEDLIRSAARNSQGGTKLVIVDWNKNSSIGISSKEKSTEEEVIIQAEKAGFQFRRLLPAGSSHFGLYFEYAGK